MAEFPKVRPRRLRRSAALRGMVQETQLSPRDFIYPLFVMPGEGEETAISSMPGQSRLTVDRAVAKCKEAFDLGVPAVILFGLPEDKDEIATGAWHEDGIVQRATRAIKEALPELLVVADTCLCEYTSHGHCGPIVDGEVHNDQALDLLSRTALSQARAGADIIAPSDMMDGRVGAIRKTLDGAGYDQIPILSYAAKYASAFYGPFRDAADSAPAFGDRRSYQMDPPNWREALREVSLDLDEGADMVMVKPAMPYLDVLCRIRQQVDVPVAAYHVSGEYAMLEAAARNGWIDRERVMLESLLSIKRAGADLILTYYAVEAARLLQ